MKRTSIIVNITLIGALLFATSCESWSNATNGGIIGSIGGTILGAGIGAAIGGDYGADLGGNLGMTVGTIAGTAIGAEQDQKEAVQQQEVAAKADEEAQSFTDAATGQKYLRLTRQNDIVFVPRSSTLDDESMNVIEHIAKGLRHYNDTIYIYGSTDNIEARGNSQALSAERARSVAGYLLSLGIPVKQIEIRGLGDQSPIADNATMEGRAENRCVEIYIKDR